MGSPFLYFAGDRLSTAELTAACLDGHLVDLGEGYIPADAVETAALRAGSLSELLGADLAATHLSAAWIHGVLPDPPGRHTVQRAASRRLHHVLGRRIVYRDLQVDPADLVRIGGVWVTAPPRTLADLARIADPRYQAAAAAMADAMPRVRSGAVAWLSEHGPLPGKAKALRMLRQDEVTRYTS
ncbi:type IV toxin-antitoxin system AbiEi family antitoxin [Microbacterium terricola]|uniref:AbiEi antitoxin C-terminal domain-containing protein n=1 Tax=Microbacterium terricola TaxID=344163 RepID=A0ABM8DYI4_9MICO|nr:type IV toxin-antitoxin system AbiEi family antitoxin [Microbacterium terricola]UYK38706.1 type IV toxin-antitoxin system AbiEi family antitoxin [Microbacterium terricola]BDV30606.1 hypothetical protein Microterr_12660 [Microbacterium terricola]